MTRPEAHLMILTELEQILNGKCSKRESTCPKYVAQRLFGWDCWDCVDCEKSFLYILNKKKMAKFMFCLPCPCWYCNNEEEPIIALEEEINRLTQIINGGQNE